MSTIRRFAAPLERQRGQAIVEFSLAILVFLAMIVGLFDLGRGVYMYNGVSEAAREIARRTIVYPGIVLGTSSETLDAIAVQRRLVPGLGNPTFSCLDISGAPTGHVPCQSGDYVQVEISAPYSPISLLGIGGPINLSSSASMQVP